MKLCVSLRDPAPKDLRSGNLRSEARWERQALEAALENPHASEVYTVGCKWAGSHPKYRGKMKANAAPETVLLMQDWNGKSATAFKFKAVFTNIFAGPWDNQMSEIKDVHRRLGGHLYLTMGFPIMYRNELGLEDLTALPSGPHGPPRSKESRLEQFVPRENVLLLPVPGSPGVVGGSNFDKTNILWAQRCIFMSQMQDSATLLWSLKLLEKDPSLTLDVLTGWRAAEVKDYVNGAVVKRPNIVDAFWALDAFAPLASVRDRVRIHLEMGWKQVLGLYAGAKLYTTYGRAFGGPPIEAGMHGLPFIACGETGALCDCPGYLHVPSEGYTTTGEESACSILDRLYADRDFYNETGDAYRQYVKENYTYEAFNNNLNRFLSDRGLL